MTDRAATSERATNWAGNVRFSAARLSRPGSISELQDLVAASGQVRALGTGHSFSQIADTRGHLIAADRLPVIMDIDAGRSVVLASAGLRYAELARYLHQAGYALANLGSLPHIGVAGACATATHGSGTANRNLAAAVAGLDLVTATGDIVTLGRDTAGTSAAARPGRRSALAAREQFRGELSHGEAGKSGDDADPFRGAVVGLGALGVVTSLTLDIQPTFEVRQYVYEDLPYAGLPPEPVGERLVEIFASGYSVSLFTDWRGPRFRQVWLKRRTDAPGQQEAAPPEWLGARLADGPRHPVPGHSAASCTTQLGVPGPWHERLPHFRPEFVPSTGAELQSEYLIGRAQAAEALARLGRIGPLVAPVLQVSELRTVAADQLWLSPSYQRDSLAIHFTWIDDAAAVAPALAAVEAELAPLGPRPHWGKLFAMDPGLVTAQYPRLADFGRLRQQLDPDGKFRNDFTDAYLAPPSPPSP